MRGKVHYIKSKDLWYVQWSDTKIYRYKGEVMKGPLAERMANKLLATIQHDMEEYPESFRIEKYTHQRTDVIPYLHDWLKTQKSTLSPATYHDYKNSIDNHLVPWFKGRMISLTEIRYDTLCQLLSEIKRDGKGRLNTMYCFHACLKYAWKSGRIPGIPPFPEKRHYGIQKKTIEWLPEARQRAIIEAIPIEHQPIFWWLKFHYRRPSEAIALHKEDYDAKQDCFIIRRGMSRKVLTETTKTHKEHIIPCHPDYRDCLRNILSYRVGADTHISPFMFTHRTSRMEGKRYQQDLLVDLWNRAARSCGESIRMYAGLKHSSCSQFINEHGGTVDELQMLTDHARRDSVMNYASVQVEAKRRLMGRVYRYKTATSKTGASNGAE